MDFAQTSHAAPQAVLQQTPSDMKPLAQSIGSIEGSPFFNLHAPLASQVDAPVHVSGSSALVTAPHVPPGSIR
jgi:hypothetical protein